MSTIVHRHTRCLNLPFTLQTPPPSLPRTSDLALKLGDQCHGVLKNGKLRQRPIQCHVQRHHAAELRKRIVDVAYPYPNRGRIENHEIYTHAACNIATVCHAPT